MTQSSVWVAVWPPEKTINAYRRRRIYVEDCQWQRQQRRSSSILICNCIICELTNWSRNDIQQFEVFQFFPLFFVLFSFQLSCVWMRACVCMFNSCWLCCWMTDGLTAMNRKHCAAPHPCFCSRAAFIHIFRSVFACTLNRNVCKFPAERLSMFCREKREAKTTTTANYENIMGAPCKWEMLQCHLIYLLASSWY